MSCTGQLYIYRCTNILLNFKAECDMPDLEPAEPDISDAGSDMKFKVRKVGFIKFFLVMIFEVLSRLTRIKWLFFLLSISQI